MTEMEVLWMILERDYVIIKKTEWERMHNEIQKALALTQATLKIGNMEIK